MPRPWRRYRKLEEVLGPEEAGTLMNHLPPPRALATRADLALLRSELKAETLAFAAGRFA